MTEALIPKDKLPAGVTLNFKFQFLNLRILGIIPSRYASARFPGKPLVMIHGKSMIQRVYEQALKSKSLRKVLVATDDERIFNHVKEFAGNVVMTSAGHHNGTERCAEALLLESGNYDAVINIQGDEPFIQPEQIDLVAECLKEGAPIATLVKRITRLEDLENISVVKAVLGANAEVKEFSRKIAASKETLNRPDFLTNTPCFKHIGIYGYKVSVLKEIVKLQPHPDEQLHSLEQLRWLKNGYQIKARKTAFETTAVDTPDDLEKVLRSQET